MLALLDWGKCVQGPYDTRWLRNRGDLGPRSSTRADPLQVTTTFTFQPYIAVLPSHENFAWAALVAKMLTKHLRELQTLGATRA